MVTMSKQGDRLVGTPADYRSSETFAAILIHSQTCKQTGVDKSEKTSNKRSYR